MPEKIVEIKDFSQEIFLFVSKLTKQLNERQKSLSTEAFRAILRSLNAHLFVMYNSDEIPVSMLTVGIYRSPTGSKAWIEDVVVDEEYRGRGFGKKIVEHAIKFIRNLNIETISLTSNSSRVAANKLYQTLGFEHYETNVYKMRFST